MISRAGGKSWRRCLTTAALVIAGVAPGAHASPLTELDTVSRFELATGCLSEGGFCGGARTWARPVATRSGTAVEFAAFERAPRLLNGAIPLPSEPGRVVSFTLSSEEALRVANRLTALQSYPPALSGIGETPLPTAVWLFGSAIVALLIFGRQRRQY